MKFENIIFVFYNCIPTPFDELPILDINLN